ncbi:helix-turn-helix transcriptional regulator [Microbacterium sp. NPDC089189]|uniref:helix-turn-helix transcriptional regulator n=1 Tax=Microbacterium sp. NPDC089189 TaxID=3154972 RepID=UPI003444FA3A
MSTAAEQQSRKAALLLGKRLRVLRQRQGKSQEAIAIAAGISTQTYAALERGCKPSGTDSNPTLKTVLRVLPALGIDPVEAILYTTRAPSASHSVDW